VTINTCVYDFRRGRSKTGRSKAGAEEENCTIPAHREVVSSHIPHHYHIPHQTTQPHHTRLPNTSHSEHLSFIPLRTFPTHLTVPAFLQSCISYYMRTHFLTDGTCSWQVNVSRPSIYVDMVAWFQNGILLWLMTPCASEMS
jgi:hypothetical protein